MTKPLVVIGHRMGQGFNVKAGVEAAGGTAIVIEGMLADMKLGQVMNEVQADLGISFCGSGGAGAITAANEFDYEAVDHLRSVDEGVSAIKQGIQVLGFGFMDTEELGEKLTTAWLEVHQNE
ncbi:SFCGS family glycine-rich protein [Spiroplasma sp. DGKH1]|uniref:SFCGS family glycine-rich protein n=1 Tax=Spiroplasma sp. DGKH1 TaxID=3050074 RepID=UPI0034C61894